MANCQLVGGLDHFLFSHILRIIIPIDFHIFQRGSNHQLVSCIFSANAGRCVRFWATAWAPKVDQYHTGETIGEAESPASNEFLLYHAMPSLEKGTNQRPDKLWESFG